MWVRYHYVEMFKRYFLEKSKIDPMGRRQSCEVRAGPRYIGPVPPPPWLKNVN
jgi:hypothetical protein